MTLENCLKCPKHVDCNMGYITCSYWPQNQQHVITKSNVNGIKIIIGCALDEVSQKKKKTP
jgi:hypothetical protein